MIYLQQNIKKPYKKKKGSGVLDKRNMDKGFAFNKKRKAFYYFSTHVPNNDFSIK